HLPGNWSSTDNATEELAFAAKDMLLAVDDFAPAGGLSEVARLHRSADRLFRNAGNRAARQRMRSDGTLRPPRPPRCLSLGTGEERPRGPSVRARLLTAEVAAGDIDAGKLSRCQQDAAAGKYAAAMAGFLQWLAGRYDQVREQLGAELTHARDGWQGG